MPIIPKVNKMVPEKKATVTNTPADPGTEKLLNFKYKLYTTIIIAITRETNPRITPIYNGLSE